ncbi:MAG TPA: hypothetical protein VMF03_20120 [Steroidobacteraceae bacterium]|nr:hypothetical protein [Steroidobacteraceae bacterium]
MKRILQAVAFSILLSGIPAAWAAPAACDRSCLYGILDQYLQALRAHNPAAAPLAANIRSTENNVVLRPGDGLWGTITGMTDYELRFADTQAEEIGFYGVAIETDTPSPFALRLKVRDRRITEAELIVARPQEAGVPFVNGKLKAIPIMNEDVPPAERSSRAQMIRLVNGYFDTLQRNDGTLHTAFAPTCNRREDGFETTNHPNSGYGDITALGCEAQFKLGWYRFDDELRARRFMVVDQERGLVMAAGFIDHAGRFGDYRLTDGRIAKNTLFHHPHSYCLLETFKLQDGKIQRVEAVFTTVPYHMPSPWVPK